MMKPLLLSLCISAACFSSGHASASTSALNIDKMSSKYDDFLRFEQKEYDTINSTLIAYKEGLLPQFDRAVEAAKSFDYPMRGQPAFYDFKLHAESEASEELRATDKANEKLRDLFADVIPNLAFAYQTPGPEGTENPYYKNPDVLKLYIDALEYTYSRGLTEDAWLTDHAGRASGKALADGLERKAGDFSSVSLHFGGFSKSIFLMRHELEKAGLLDKYRGVLRNLSVNNGHMYNVFYEMARKDASYGFSVKITKKNQYYVSADGIRLFVDYFIPYFLLIESPAELETMSEILANVVKRNIAITEGTQGTIKIDGTGFHHHTAYVAGYSPYAYESFAQLLYLLADTKLYDKSNVDAVKLALESFRVMAQKYEVSSSLKGRLIIGNPESPAIAVTKAMALLAAPEGINDPEMQARLLEYFDENHLFSASNINEYYVGKRGVPITGLGIFGIIDSIMKLDTPPATTPSGTWIKPYAAAGFYRQDNWLVTAKGFSQYVFDYEGPLNKHQNSFGQNWSMGLLQVFNTGKPIGEKGSGYDLANGWDWYHVPGTTASHYPIEERVDKKVKASRKKQRIQQRNIHRNYNSKTYVGGVFLGDNGFFVQDLEALPFTSPTNLTARKTYFFTGGKVLALGTDISGGTREDETHTTLFQTSLQSKDQQTTINGQKIDGLTTHITIPAGKPAAITDTVGNSYYLANSSADLVITRQMQKSLTTGYKPTTGLFKQAYINHGIKPKLDTYEYVLIPDDLTGEKLKELAGKPSDFYQVIKRDDHMHLVEFPQESLTAYAFYDSGVDTPETVVIKEVNIPAAILQQKKGNSLHIAASVPDIGWELDRQKVTRGGSGAGKDYFNSQPAKRHELEITLRGKWKLATPGSNISFKHGSGNTYVELVASNGLTENFVLTPAS